MDAWFIFSDWIIFRPIREPNSSSLIERKKRLGTLGFVTIIAHEERKKIHMTIFRKLITRIFFDKILISKKYNAARLPDDNLVWIPQGEVKKRRPSGRRTTLYQFINFNSSVLILLTLLLGCISYLEYYNREFITAGAYLSSKRE